MKKILITTSLAIAGLNINANPVKHIGGTLSSDLYLYKDTCYFLTSSLVVPNTFKLDIEAGTEIRCDEATSVIIERGGRIEAMGTDDEPIVFTSSKAPNSRAAGDWGGIVALGYASNNIVDNGGGVYNIFRAGANRAGGGTPIDEAYNAGTIQYTRIEFAGGGDSGETEVHALALNGTGSGTTIDHIQISDCLGSGLWMGGGKTDISTVYVLNAYQKGIKLTLGNRSQLQTILVQSNNPAAHDASGTDGLFIENNPDNIGYQPYTYPIISNFTLLGINACDEEEYDNDFRDGIYLTNNARADIFNSVIKGYERGIYIDDQNTIDNTANDELNIAYSTFTGNMASPQYAYNGALTWFGNGCDDDMAEWIGDVGGFAGCIEMGNQFGSFSTNYNSTFCDDYCSVEFEPNFIINTPVPLQLQEPDYTSLSGFFNQPTYRGAIQTAQIFDDWIRVCSQEETYCVETQEQHKPFTNLSIYPNPATKIATVSFKAKVTGSAQVVLMEKVSGRILYKQTHYLNHNGKQEFNIPVAGLKEDVYAIIVRMNEQVWYGALVIKQD